MKEQADFLIYNTSQVLTCAGPPRARRREELREIGLIPRGAVAARQGKIIAVGTEKQVFDAVETTPDAVIIDAQRSVLIPGLVDCHTHVLYSGTRAEEFSLKLKGVSYLEILASGGGINYTVNQTRQATDEAILEQTIARLRTMLRYGTTTVEIKSGYGLNTEEELRHLSLINKLSSLVPLDIVPTFMGAHAIPGEYSGHPDKYVAIIVEEMLPQVAARHLAEFCDVFCEQGAFTAFQSERILTKASELGLRIKIHAEEMGNTGGALLAAKLNAHSAEHLLYIDRDAISALARSGTIAVLLPGTSFYLRERYAPARSLIDAGVPVAIATDANPGSCPNENLQLVINLACLYLQMTPEEAISAATINAAYAAGRGQKVGSLEVGKNADMVVLNPDDFRFLAYHFGTNLAKYTVKNGRIAANGEYDYKKQEQQ